MTTYTIKHVAGYSAVDHFGREIELYAAGSYKTLTAAKTAVKRARAMVGHPQSGAPRIDIVSSKGKVSEWC